MSEPRELDSADFYALETELMRTKVALAEAESRCEQAAEQLKALNELAMRTSERLVDAWSWSARWKALAKHYYGELEQWLVDFEACSNEWAASHRLTIAERDALRARIEELEGSLGIQKAGRTLYLARIEARDEYIAKLQSQIERLQSEQAEFTKLLDQTANECLTYEAENTTLRALIVELVNALVDFSSGNCGEHLYLDANQQPQEVSQLIARARAAISDVR